MPGIMAILEFGLVLFGYCLAGRIPLFAFAPPPCSPLAFCLGRCVCAHAEGDIEIAVGEPFYQYVRSGEGGGGVDFHILV